MTIEFTDPPTAHRKTVRFDWDKIAAQLRANPTEWARIAEQGKVSVANAISEGKISNFHPSSGYEVTTADTNRDAKPRTADIFVRYNPEKDQGITVKERRKVMAAARRAGKEKGMHDPVRKANEGGG